MSIFLNGGVLCFVSQKMNPSNVPPQGARASRQPRAARRPPRNARGRPGNVQNSGQTSPTSSDLAASSTRGKRGITPSTGQPRESQNDVTSFDSVDNEFARPVLKFRTESDPSAQNPKKRRQSRARNVRFVSEPDFSAESAPLPTIRPATKTGFTELPFKDLLVILGLWFMRFFIPWVDAWYNFNFYLLREPYFWNNLEPSVLLQERIHFCGISFITIIVSAVADYVNGRFYVLMVLMVLYILCPLSGGFLNSVLVARNYDQDFYRKWALASDTLFHWASAISFVSFPIQLSCIFAQIDDMSRQAHFNWIAFLVCLESINSYIAFWVIPGKCPTRTFTQTAVWFLIGVAIFSVFLLNVNFTRDWAKPGILQSRWNTHETAKDKKQDDVDIKAKRLKKLLWFCSILTFIVFDSFVFATLGRLNPDENWDKHYFLSATSMFIVGKILGTAFMAVTLTVVRQTLQYYFSLPFLRPDVLALGLPHIINLIALVALLGRFASLSHLKEGDVIVGPIPEANKMVAEFYNFDYRNRTLCVHSTFFRPLKIDPRQRGTREVYDTGITRVYFTVTLDPSTTPSLMARGSFEYTNNKWVTFVITLPYSNIKFSDVQALYSKPEIIRVEGTQKLRPKKSPQLYFLNTFVLNNSGKIKWVFNVKDDSGFNEEFLYNLRWLTVILPTPKGHLEVKYHLANTTDPPPPVTTTVDADEYTVWSVVLGHARPMKQEETVPHRMMLAYKTMETAGPDSRHLPGKLQLQRDIAIMAGMTLAGMASSGIFIGMMYLFWLDTPYDAFRTSCIGAFWVVLNIPADLSQTKDIDVGFVVISVLAFLQILTTVLHFYAAAQLYSPKFNFRARLD